MTLPDPDAQWLADHTCDDCGKVFDDLDDNGLCEDCAFESMVGVADFLMDRSKDT